MTAFNVNNEMDLIDSLEKNDILFIFPHQIKLFPRKTFDISLAVDCLHEMEKKIIKEYMINFENVSNGMSLTNVLRLMSKKEAKGGKVGAFSTCL